MSPSSTPGQSTGDSRERPGEYREWWLWDQLAMRRVLVTSAAPPALNSDTQIKIGYNQTSLLIIAGTFC